MPNNNFHQTVDLREQAEKRRQDAPSGVRRDAMHCVSTPLEKIYQAAGGAEAEKDLRTINRPRRDAMHCVSTTTRSAVFILAIIILGITAYFLFFRPARAPEAARESNWYAVKLVDGEIFYGQIADVKSDPVVMANVYYDYDQAKEKTAKESAKASEQSGNIRLVKRGKETQGGSGSLKVVRGQILYLEPLKNDSKVLQAILEYEK